MAINGFACALLLTAITLVSGQGCDPYRQFQQHTMCIYREKACRPGAQLIKSDGFTDYEKNQIVDLHNSLRNDIVEGRIMNAPAAERMAHMMWDDELAEIAQRLADQCSLIHDRERRVPRFYVGQNVYMSYRSPIETDQSPNVTQAILSWFNEIYTAGFPREYISPFRFVYEAGHYTQIAWADTYTIGCGYTMFTSNGWSNKLIVCNYGPGGNMIGRTMYQVK